MNFKFKQRGGLLYKISAATAQVVGILDTTIATRANLLQFIEGETPAQPASQNEDDYQSLLPVPEPPPTLSSPRPQLRLAPRAPRRPLPLPTAGMPPDDYGDDGNNFSAPPASRPSGALTVGDRYIPARSLGSNSNTQASKVPKPDFSRLYKPRLAED